ncbi:MAG: succinate dehydrogenase/fumarate reductase iron-sulfur subunit [Promethearchaeota archaeon]
MKLRVYRFSKDMREAKYDVYEIKNRAGMTVLEGLFHIQDHLDDSLSFRYSCRGAVCGSCAMLINKVPRLACRTQLTEIYRNTRSRLKPFPPLTDLASNWKPDEEILVEPLPNFPVIKDLIYDWRPFFEKYKKVLPWLITQKESPEKEYLMKAKDAQKIERFVNCILCAACYGSCPVNHKTKEYLGPAALALAYRFYLDPRDSRKEKIIVNLNNKPGIQGCEFVYNCVQVCPKDVAPGFAITLMRQRSDEILGDEKIEKKD